MDQSTPYVDNSTTPVLDSVMFENDLLMQAYKANPMNGSSLSKQLKPLKLQISSSRNHNTINDDLVQVFTNQKRHLTLVPVIQKKSQSPPSRQVYKELKSKQINFHSLSNNQIIQYNTVTKQSLETTGRINPMSSYEHQSITNNSGASSKYPCINIRVNIKQSEQMKQIYENQQQINQRLNKHQSNSQRTIDNTDPYLQAKTSKHSILSTQRTNSISHPYLPKDLILTSVPLRAYTKTLLRTDQSPDYPALPTSTSAQKIPKIHKFPLITAIKQSRSRTNVYESGLPLKDFFDGAISHRSIMPQPALGEQIVLDSNRRRHEHLYKIIKNQNTQLRTTQLCNLAA